MLTLLSECDLQLTLDWLERCELIVKAYGLGAAAGRAEFVVCEIAATLLVPDTAAGELLGEARLLLSLPALVGAVEAGRLRLPLARRVLSELLPVEEALREAIVADVLGRVADQPPAAVGQIVRGRFSVPTPARPTSAATLPRSTAGWCCTPPRSAWPIWC